MSDERNGIPSERTWVGSGALDLALSLGFVLPKTPALLRREGQQVTFTLNTSDGPATVILTQTAGEIRGRGLGPGAAMALDMVPRLVGFDDDPDDFDPPPGLIAELHRRNRGLRLGSSGRVFDVMLPTIIGQRVTREEAKRSYRRLVAAIGEPAPGVDGMSLPPVPERVFGLSADEMRAFGIERSRGRIVREVARSRRRLEEILEMDGDNARARLEAFPGVGPWTAANVMGAAWGDRDAVPVGDFHLPNTVAWALAGEDRATDDRMLDLLEPYRPYRRRAILLIKLSGIHAPRYGPRTPKSTISRG